MGLFTLCLQDCSYLNYSLMGKRKNSDSKINFTECIDPRFSGTFCSKNICENGELSKTESLANVSKVKHQDNVSGFQAFIGTKLSTYLDKNIKEVDRPVLENDFFKNRLESIRLFTDSDPMTELRSADITERKPKKKKHKKDRSEKEKLKEAVVTYDWIQRQAKILNS